jgi:hypothetical protein
MSTFTKQLTAVNDAALAAANAVANASLPDGATPLTDHEYLSAVLDGVLKSYQDQYSRLTSGAFLLRFPAGKIDQIKAAAASNAQLAAYIAEVEANPYVYTGSTLVRGGIALLVQSGLLTQAQADVILA